MKTFVRLIRRYVLAGNVRILRKFKRRLRQASAELKPAEVNCGCSKRTRKEHPL